MVKRFQSLLVLFIILSTQPLLNVQAKPSSPAPSQAPTLLGDTNALVLDGIGDYVRVPHHPELNPSDAISIEAWVNRDSSSRCETVVGKNWQESYWLGFCNSQIRFYPHGSDSSLDGNAAIPAHVWTHIAVTYDGTTRRYYIDGELDFESTAKSGPPSSSAADLAIGADLNGGNLYAFSGRLDEVRLWNRVLSQAEIQANMYGDTEINSSPGLAAFWPLNENGGEWHGGGVRHAGTLEGNAFFNNTGIEYDWMWIPKNTTNVTTDGHCDPSEYTGAFNYPTGNGLTLVKWVNWPAKVHICFTALEKSAGSQASVGLDLNYNRSSLPDSQDYLFSIDLDGVTTAQIGDGAGWQPYSPAPDFWQAVRYSDPGNPSSWSAEFSFPLSFFPMDLSNRGFDFGIGLFEGRSGLPSEAHPGAARESRPESWGEGELIDPFYGAHSRSFAGQVLDDQTGLGIPGVRVWLSQDTPWGVFLLDETTTDADGAYTFYKNSVSIGTYLVRVNDLGGYSSVSAAVGDDGQVISPNSVIYPITYSCCNYSPAVFLDTQGLPMPRTFDKHYLLVYSDPVLIYDLIPLLTLKQRQGFQVEAKDVASIVAEFSGYDKAEKIRNYLKARWQAYSPHPVYALLVGRHNLIPMRDMGWKGDFDHRSPGEPNYGPAYVSDWYYADLDSNWDPDNDHFYGEYLFCEPASFQVPLEGLDLPGRCPEATSPLREGPYGSSPASEDDWLPEISLGRLLVGTRAEVRAALETSILSEASGSPVKGKALLAGSIYNFYGRSWDAANNVYINGGGPGIYGEWPASGNRPFGNDAAHIFENSLKPALLPYMDLFTTLYETTSPNNNPLLIPTTYTSTASLNYTNFNNYFALGFGLVNVNGHGSAQGVLNESWTVDRNSNGKIENPVNPGELAACLSNCWELSPQKFYIDINIAAPPSPVAPVIFASACATGSWYKNLDFFGNVIPENQAIAGLAPAQGKAAAWIGGLSLVPVRGYDNTQSAFNQDTIIKPLALGDAFWKGMQAAHSEGPWDWRMHTLMLFGDPAYSYWGNGLDTRAPWPQSAQNWFGSGATRYNGPETGMIKWTLTTSNPLSPPVVNSRGHILVGTQTGMASFNTRGQLIRAVNIGAPVYSTPALGMDGVYFASGSVLYAYDPDLFYRWQVSLPGQSQGEPRIGPDGVVWIPTSAGMVRLTGAGLPELLSGGTATSPAALTLSGAAVWAGGSATLYGYFMDQQGQVSRDQVAFSGAGTLTAPVVAPDGDIYVGASNSNLYKVPGFPFPPAPTQVYDADGAITARPVVGDDGSVYFGTVLGKLYALNPDGSLRWRLELPWPIQTPPALDPNHLYLVVGNQLQVYDPGSGGLQWTLPLGEGSSVRSTPAIDGVRRLYVSLNNFKLVSVYEGPVVNVPENLLLTPGPGQMVVQWNDASTNETGFRVEYCVLNEVCQLATQTGPNATKVTLNPAIYGQAVRFRVQSLGAYGGSMPQDPLIPQGYNSEFIYSDYTHVPPPYPAAPTGLSASALSSAAIQVTWNYSGAYPDLLTAFRIYRSTSLNGSYSQVGLTGPASRDFVDEGLSPGVFYYYRVASETFGSISGLSAAASAQTRLQTLLAPSHLLAVQQDDLSVLLTWVDHATNETGYLVERKLPGMGNYELIATLPANTTSYSDPAAQLVEGLVEYRVRAYTATNESVPIWTVLDYLLAYQYDILLPLVVKP